MEDGGAAGKETWAEEDKVTPEPESCAGCSRPIRDRYIYKVVDRAWHAACLRCHDCGVALKEKCFCRDENLFCRDDFFRRYGIKCTECGKGIPPNTVVRRALENVYHMDCFQCSTCQRRLDTGDEFFLLEGGRIICKEDKHKDGSEESAVKRPRTTISSGQQDLLKLAYAQNPRPQRTVREDLAKQVGLSARVVQVWFQNRRAKEKRSQKESLESSSSIKSKKGVQSKTKEKTGAKTSKLAIPPPLPEQNISDELPSDTSSRVRRSRTTRTTRTTRQSAAGNLLEPAEVHLTAAKEVLSILSELKDETLPESDLALEIESEVATELDIAGHGFDSNEPLISQQSGHSQTSRSSHYDGSYSGSVDCLEHGSQTLASTGTLLEQSPFSPSPRYSYRPRSRSSPRSVTPSQGASSNVSPVSSSFFDLSWFGRPPDRPH